MGVAVEHLVDNYSMVGDMITLACCAVIQIIIYRVLYFSEDEKFTFLKKALNSIAIGALANISFDMVCLHFSNRIWLMVVLRDIYHLCFLLCLEFYLIYMRRMLDVEGKLVKTFSYITRILLIICMTLDVLSPWTKFGLHQTADGLWKNPLVSAYNVFYMYAVILMFVMLVGYSSRIIKSVRDCLIAAEVVVAVLMTYSAIVDTNSYTSFTYLLPIFVVMILLHSRPFNDQTGALSGDSFNRYVAQNFKDGISNDYMILRLDLSVLKHIPKELGKTLNSFWFGSFRETLMFNPDNDLYILAVPRKGRNGDTEEKVKRLFKKEFMPLYARYQISYKVIGLFDIDFAENAEQLLSMINYLTSKMEENSILVSSAEIKDELRLLNSVHENLADIAEGEDLNDPRILAYCQPIRNMKTGQFDTAEALMRMSIPEKSFVTPNLFIPLAEYYGYIHTLSRIMLNKVCREVKRLDEEGYHFKRISVNFVASEMIKNDFCQEILQIIRDNGIDPSRIGIELTESQNESDFKLIKERINVLREAGMTLYLDDIGTGYSNLDRIVRYDVDVVKFDRFFLLEAEKDKRVVYMMKHLSDAFRDLKYSLLYEGVETEENENLCMDCGADYIQGFKYSKPIPIENLRDFFAKEM